MESFFVRYRNPLLLVALVLVQVIMLASQIGRPSVSGIRGSSGANASQPLDHPDAHSVRLIRLWTEGAASPFERSLYWVGHGVRSVWGNYFALRGARKQNEDLKAEVERLRLEQASLAEDARQDHRLQTMLDFKQHYMGKLLPAQIIGTSGSDQSHVLYIDKGKADGLKPGMPVITPDGVVGKVRDVLANTSQVLLINDQSSGAGVLLQTTRIRGVIRGNAYGQLEIVNVMPDDRIQPGEEVLASGGDQIFPRGMPVGTVERVQHDPAHDPYIQVVVKPAANLAQLEEVMVVMTQAAAPPAALAEDVATSEDMVAQQKKAAEVLAEKLPTVKPEELQANEMATGPDRPHQPPQPLHPDRFSVGATPPATEMQPGARTVAPLSGWLAANSSGKQTATSQATAQTARTAAKTSNPDDTAAISAQPVNAQTRPRTKTPAADAAATDAASADGTGSDRTLKGEADTEDAQAAKSADKPAKPKKSSKDSTVNPEDFAPIKSPADAPADKP